ncbi:MAG: iron chaperone [Ilumatobacteraceae bacterium]
MASGTGSRSQHFPAIERKHGQPVSFWLERLASLEGAKYADQIALLREGHGFSQAHANAVVMYARGSTTTRRYAGADDFLAKLAPKTSTTVSAIFAAITERYPQSEVVIAWNQPIARIDGHYVMGVSVATRHLTVNPWSRTVLTAMADRLTGLVVNKHTFCVPLDWRVDSSLLHDMVAHRLAEVAAG